MPDFVSFDHSPVATPYFTHYNALKPVERLEVGKSIALPKNGLQEAFLRGTLKDFCKGGRVFVLIDHEEGFEVLRLPDGASASWFYACISANKRGGIAKGTEEDEHKKLVELACIQFLRSAWPEVAGYCVGTGLRQAHENQVIPYAYIQRKLASVAVFRSYRLGSSDALKNAVEALKKEKSLSELSPVETMGSFKTRSRCFRYLKALAPMGEY